MAGSCFTFMPNYSFDRKPYFHCIHSISLPLSHMPPCPSILFGAEIYYLLPSSSMIISLRRALWMHLPRWWSPGATGPMGACRLTTQPRMDPRRPVGAGGGHGSEGRRELEEQLGEAAGGGSWRRGLGEGAGGGSGADPHGLGGSTVEKSG